MGFVAGLFSALAGVVAFGLGLLPLIIALVALSKLSAMARDLAVMRQQVAQLSEQAGIPSPPPPPPAVNPPPWSWALVAGGVLFVLGVVAFVDVAARDDGGTFEYRSLTPTQEPEAEIVP